MTKNDRLYKETLVRVGPEKMRGVNNLLEGKYTGVAERHTVGYLMAYIKGLEERLGIHVPDPDHAPIIKGMIKIKEAGSTYYATAG